MRWVHFGKQLHSFGMVINYSYSNIFETYFNDSYFDIFANSCYLRLGYEVEGMENVPNEGAAMFVYYHGAVPVDIYFFISKVYVYQKRNIYSVGHRLLSKIPGSDLNM